MHHSVYSVSHPFCLHRLFVLFTFCALPLHFAREKFQKLTVNASPAGNDTIVEWIIERSWKEKSERMKWKISQITTSTSNWIRWKSWALHWMNMNTEHWTHKMLKSFHTCSMIVKLSHFTPFENHSHFPFSILSSPFYIKHMEKQIHPTLLYST